MDIADATRQTNVVLFGRPHLLYTRKSGDEGAVGARICRAYQRFNVENVILLATDGGMWPSVGVRLQTMLAL